VLIFSDQWGVLISRLVSLLNLLVGEEGMLYLYMMTQILMMKIDGERVRVMVRGNCLTYWLGVLISRLVSLLNLLVGEEGMLYLYMMTEILMMKIDGGR
jgi:hypothetical protein